MSVIDSKPDKSLFGTKVTVVGVARNAHSGGVVMLSDRRTIFVDGLEYGWDDPWNGVKVQVTGTLNLRKLAPDPEVDADGAVSHGMHGSVLILDEPAWEAATP